MPQNIKFNIAMNHSMKTFWKQVKVKENYLKV